MKEAFRPKGRGSLLDEAIFCSTSFKNEVFCREVIRLQMTRRSKIVRWYKKHDSQIDEERPIPPFVNLPLWTSVKTLNLSGMGMTEIWILPENLERLNCSFCLSLTKISCTLPSKLRYLNFRFSPIRKIKAVPDTLVYFDCSHSNTFGLPSFPDALRFLDCYSSMDHPGFLPPELKVLMCGRANETHSAIIRSFPKGLVRLGCAGVIIETPLPRRLKRLTLENSVLCVDDKGHTILPDEIQKLSLFQFEACDRIVCLPPRLVELFCYECEWTKLPPLPSTLKKLMFVNGTTTIPLLPVGLTHFWCDSTIVKPRLPKSLETCHIDTYPRNLPPKNAKEFLVEQMENDITDWRRGIAIIRFVFAKRLFCFLWCVHKTNS